MMVRGPKTDAVLDALKLYGLKATFFMVGSQVEMYPEIAQRVVTEGHYVGNHSWDHPELTTLTEAELDWQLGSTNDIILQVTGVTPKFARPPYGARTRRSGRRWPGTACERSCGPRTASIGMELRRTRS